MSIFVDPDTSGAPGHIPMLELHSEEDHRLDQHARHLAVLRSQVAHVPKSAIDLV